MNCCVANRILYFQGILFVVIMLLLPTLIYAGTFKDNFNDGDAKGWKIEGNAAGKWVIKDGGYNGSIAAEVESIALVGEDDWEVDSIEVKVRNPQGSYLAIAFRYRDLNNFDSWWLDIANKRLEAWPKIGDYENNARAVSAVPLDPQKECTIKVVIDKNNFSVFFDGKKVSEYNNDKFKTGRVGLLVWAGSATFDDVVIEGKNVAGIMVVKPYKNQTTLWGAIKSH